MTKSRGMRWARHLVWMWAGRKAYKMLSVKPQESRPLGIHGRGDTVEMDLRV
jgi:hypothetical protein